MSEKSAADGAVDYLILGHVVVDRVTDTRVVLGGTATYASLAARNMGARVAIHTSASYEPGLVDTLHGTMVARIPAEYTTCFVNTYDADGHRHQRVESVAERLAFEQLLPEWRHPPVVHLAPLCQEMDGSLVDKFPRSLIGVTPQGWMRAWGEDGVVHPSDWTDADRVLARADAVIVAEEDFTDASLIHAWAARTRLLVVTLAERGCAVYARGEAGPYYSPAFRVERAVDPTGAGDVFSAAFLWHLRQSNGNWRQAADWANCVASFVVERRGVAGVPKLVDAEKRWRAGKRVPAGAPPA